MLHSWFLLSILYLVVCGEGNGDPLRYSSLENPMDGGAWWATVHGSLEESDTTERLHFPFSLLCFGEGNGDPLRYSSLENPSDGGAWRAAVYGIAQSQTGLTRLSSSSSSVYLLILNSLFIPPSSFPFGNNQFVFCVCERVSILRFASFFRSHI